MCMTLITINIHGPRNAIAFSKDRGTNPNGWYATGDTNTLFSVVIWLSITICSMYNSSYELRQVLKSKIHLVYEIEIM